MRNNLSDGIYDDLSFIEYHNDSAVGSSTLKTIIQRTPAHINMRTISREVADIGTAVHCALLEPDKFATTIICGPVNRRGNQWKDSCAEAEINGQTLLIEEDFATVTQIRDAVFANKTCRELLENKLVAERSLFWTDKETGLHCKARPDLITKDNMIVDVKTTISAHPDSFARDVMKYGYSYQENHYVEGAYATFNDGFAVQDFVFMCIEKTPPYACAVYRLKPEDVGYATLKRKEAMRIYKRCMELGQWHGYAEGIQELKIPAEAG